MCNKLIAAGGTVVAWVPFWDLNWLLAGCGQASWVLCDYFEYFDKKFSYDSIYNIFSMESKIVDKWFLEFRENESGNTGYTRGMWVIADVHKFFFHWEIGSNSLPLGGLSDLQPMNVQKWCCMASEARRRDMKLPDGSIGTFTLGHYQLLFWENLRLHGQAMWGCSDWQS